MDVDSPAMEKVCGRLKPWYYGSMFRPLLRPSSWLISLILVAGCASRVLQYEKADEALKNEEYENKMQVKPAEPPPPQPEVKEMARATEPKKKRTSLKHPGKIKKEATKTPGPHEPDLEDSQ